MVDGGNVFDVQVFVVEVVLQLQFGVGQGQFFYFDVFVGNEMYVQWFVLAMFCGFEFWSIVVVMYYVLAGQGDVGSVFGVDECFVVVVFCVGMDGVLFYVWIVVQIGVVE